MANYSYRWADLNEVRKRHEQLNLIINSVKKDLKDKISIQPSFRVGSGGRNLTTELINGNDGFDLDCNLKVTLIDDSLDARQIRQMLMDSFTKESKAYGYSPAQDKTRVFTLKIKDTEEKKIIFSCDFAILRELDDSSIQIIHFDKKTNTYMWADQTKSYRLMEKEEDFCKKKIGVWQEVRLYYLDRKDYYGPSKPSIEIYLESLDAIAKKNGFQDK